MTQQQTEAGIGAEIREKIEAVPFPVGTDEPPEDFRRATPAPLLVHVYYTPREWRAFARWLATGLDDRPPFRTWRDLAEAVVDILADGEYGPSIRLPTVGDVARLLARHGIELDAPIEVC